VQYYNLMGPPLYTRSVVDRNVVMRRMTVLAYCWHAVFCATATIRTHHVSERIKWLIFVM